MKTLTRRQKQKEVARQQVEASIVVAIQQLRAASNKLISSRGAGLSEPMQMILRWIINDILGLLGTVSRIVERPTVLGDV